MCYVVDPNIDSIFTRLSMRHNTTTVNQTQSCNFDDFCHDGSGKNGGSVTEGIKRNWVGLRTISKKFENHLLLRTIFSNVHFENHLLSLLPAPCCSQAALAPSLAAAAQPARLQRSPAVASASKAAPKTQLKDGPQPENRRRTKAEMLCTHSLSTSTPEL